MMGWYNDGSTGAGGWIAMILMMSLFWGAVIFVGVILFRGDGKRQNLGLGASLGHRRRVLDAGDRHRDADDRWDRRVAGAACYNSDQHYRAYLRTAWQVAKHARPIRLMSRSTAKRISVA